MMRDDSNTLRRSLRAGFRWAIAGCAGAAMTAGALADPPPEPPACDAEVDPLFCIRVTDVEQVEGDTYRIMMEFVNWTVGDAHAVHFALNNGTSGPRLRTSAEGGVFVAKKGRPFCTMDPPPNMCDPEPPEGNLGTENCFIPVQFGDSKASFYWDSVQTIPPAQAMGTINGVPTLFSGLYDPLLPDADNCGQVISDMIPGSVYVPGPPPRVVIDEPETIDDGPNVLDGFVLVIDGLSDMAVVSFNWWLSGPDKEDPIRLPDGTVDPMATGIINLTNILPPFPPPAPPLGDLRDNSDEVFAAPVPFGVNTGFNPLSTKDANNPRFWAEDVVNGVANHPINPIPAGKPGAGAWFGVEFGATVWAPFINPDDNTTVVEPNINLGPNPDPCIAADIDNDGLVNVRDALIVMHNMPPNVWIDIEADVNKDGKVDMRDLEFVITSISPCRPQTPTRPGVIGNQGEIEPGANPLKR